MPELITYGAAEGGSVNAVAKKYGVKKLSGRDEGKAKHVHALVLQSIQRHGMNVPQHVVLAEVKRSAKRSGLYGNPLLILLMPFLIQFIQSMLPVIMKYIIDLLNGLNKPQQAAMLGTLAGSAKQRWSLD